MPVCEVCHNEYAQAFEVRLAGGKTHVFDCFQCAIHALAPTCTQCGAKIVGHGIEVKGTFYCCEHCATHELQRGNRM